MKHSKYMIGIILALALILTACGSSEAPKATSPEGTYVKPVESTNLAQTISTAATTAQPAETTMPVSTTESAVTTPAATTEAATTPASTTLEVISSGLAPGQTTPGADTPADSGSFGEEDLVFTYKGKSISPGDVFVYEDYEADWGTPQIEKGQACIGGGFDENYYFEDYLAVFTLGDSGNQVIYDIFMMEEGYTTAKGAVIGQTTREELAAIYGQPVSSMGATDRYEWGDTLVSFTFSGGILAEIDYNNTQN